MMTNITRTIVASIGLAFAVAACGGSSGVTPAAGMQPVATPAGRSGNAVFIVKIPHAAVSSSDTKRTAYLTPQVQGIDFTVSASDGTAPSFRGYVFYALSPQATYCANSASALTCTLSVQAYPGNDFFAVKTYDQNNPTTPGGNGGSSYVISTGYVNATIGAGATNTISIATSGIVSTVLIGLDNPYPVAGTPLVQNVHVTGVDADNNVIVGNFDSPLTLTDSDTSGVTTLSTNSIASSGAAATMTYNGGSLGAVAFIKATTTSPADYNNRGPFNAQTGFYPGGTSLWTAPQYLTFGGVSSPPQTITVNGTNATWSFTGGCVGTVTISGTAPTYTVTPVAAGKCTMQLTYGTPPGVITTVSVPIVISPN
jgi:uncharacterized membrane protein YdcZ (DUF606 family)